MLRNMDVLALSTALANILNEVLSLNAQESSLERNGVELQSILNEVLSLNAQE